jgi:endonuclease YncB( thermonuclease family)
MAMEPYDLKGLEAATYANTKAFNYDGKSYMVKVVKVYDADTLTVAFSPSQGMGIHRYQVRLLGYDSPEMKSKNPLEKKWAYNLQKYANCLVGNTICRLECEKMDKYGRILGRLIIVPKDSGNVDGVGVEGGIQGCLNDHMLATGVCKPYGVDGGAPAKAGASAKADALKKEAWLEADFSLEKLGKDFAEFCEKNKLM